MPIDLPAPYVPQVDWAYSEAGSGNEDRLKILFVGNFRGTGIPLEVPLSVQNSRELLRFWAPSIDLDLEVVLDGVHERVCMRYQPVDIQSFLSPLSACTAAAPPTPARGAPRSL